MDRVNVPEQLKGPWDSLLVLTYTAQLDFYENALVRQLQDRCRNRVILCDQEHYQAVCEQVAQSPGLLRSVNQRYLFAGIRCPSGVAHGKCILLLNREEGRLLVGSGNLGMRGYAHNEEQFTVWTYKPEDPAQLSEFVAMRRIVEDLASRGWSQPEAVAQINAMWDAAPWIRTGAALPESRVRSNLETPFLDQLVSAIAGEPVEDLHVMSAFYDENVAALAGLLRELNPASVRVYVQPKQTSVDPQSLHAVLESWGGDYEVLTYSTVGTKGRAYCHAKQIVANTATRSICLQGSPNMSQVAFLRPATRGNFEMANLLQGERGAFDYVWDELRTVKSVKDVEKIDVKFLPVSEVEKGAEPAWRLLGGSVDGSRLSLYARGEAPFEKAVSLRLGEQDFPGELRSVSGGVIQFTITDELCRLLGSPRALRLVWRDTEGVEHGSNPVVLCNIARLNQTINANVVSRSAQTYGALDLDDDEIEALIVEMSAGLLQDRADAFRVAGTARAERVSEAAEGETERDLIDWDAVRTSTRYKQYLSGKAAGAHSNGSLLSALLNSINEQFRGLTTPAQPVGADVSQDEFTLVEDDVSEEEHAVGDDTSAVAQAILAERRRHEAAKHLWRVLSGFIKRFTTGTFDPIFTSQMGPTVVIKNYRVIVHLLTLLLDRSGSRPEFDASLLAQTTEETVLRALREYLARLQPPYDADADELLSGDTVVSGTLVALSLAAESASSLGGEEQHKLAREAVQAVLSEPRLPLTPGVGAEMDEALRSITRTRVRTLDSAVAELRCAADWCTNVELRRAIASAMHLDPGTLLFDGSKGAASAERRLLIEPRVGHLSEAQVLAGLAVWMPARPAASYRFSVGSSEFVKRRAGSEWTYDTADLVLSDGQSVRLGALPDANPSQWAECLDRLRS